MSFGITWLTICVIIGFCRVCYLLEKILSAMQAK